MSDFIAQILVWAYAIYLSIYLCACVCVYNVVTDLYFSIKCMKNLKTVYDPLLPSDLLQGFLNSTSR